MRPPALTSGVADCTAGAAIIPTSNKADFQDTDESLHDGSLFPRKINVLLL